MVSANTQKKLYTFNFSVSQCKVRIIHIYYSIYTFVCMISVIDVKNKLLIILLTSYKLINTGLFWWILQLFVQPQNNVVIKVMFLRENQNILCYLG